MGADWRQLARGLSQENRRAKALAAYWHAHVSAPEDEETLAELTGFGCRFHLWSANRAQACAKLLVGRDVARYRRYVALVQASLTTRARFLMDMTRAAIVECPNNPELYDYLGRSGDGPPPVAGRLKLLSRAFKLGRLDLRLLQSMGSYLRENGDFKGSEAWFKRAGAAYPGDPQAWLKLFSIGRNRQSDELALQQITRAWHCCAKDPSGANAVVTLPRATSILRLLGDTAPIIPEFVRALEGGDLEPANRDRLMQELARCQIEAGALDDAKQNLRRLEQRRSNRASTYLLADWASYYYKAGRPTDYHSLADRAFIKSYDLSNLEPDLDLATFNSALLRSVVRHPSLAVLYDGAQGGMHQTADRGPGSLLVDPAPELVQLRGYFARLLDRYRSDLPDDPAHPFLKFRSSPAEIEMFWGLVVRNCHASYTHRHGAETFVTAIYYAHDQPVIGDGENQRAGWFEAMRSDLNIEMDPADILEFDPYPGRFLFLPAYFYHRALPTLSQQTRLSIVADFNFVLD